MNGIYLTMAELELLARCSGVAVKAYLRMRARMDLNTGIVGVRSGLSYQALREWTEEAVEKGAGEAVVQPSMQNIRTAVNQLVRRGLLRRARTEGLVFKCILANVASARPNQTQHEPNRAKTPEPNTEPNTEPDTNPTEPKPTHGAGLRVVAPPEPDTEPNTEPNTYPTGQKSPYPTNIRDQSLKASTSQAAYTESSEVDADNPIAASVAALWSAKKIGTANPSEEVSRRATAIAVMLRMEQVSTTAMNPTVIGWAEAGVRDEQLRAALDLARQRRQAEGSLQPVNAGFLGACLQSVLRPPKPKAEPWWLSAAAMEAKARELGIPGARPGEEMAAFKTRIAAAVRRGEEGVA